MLVSQHTLGKAVDFTKQTFDSPVVSDSKVYYTCFLPTTENTHNLKNLVPTS